MAKKKKWAPGQELQHYRDALMKRMERWGELRMHGGSDPGWPDGTNMNLARENIISYKRDIEETCMVYGLPYPPEYFLDVPPKVPNDYMANLGQARRVWRLMRMGHKLTTEWR